MRRITVLVMGMLAVLIAAGVAYASIPGPDGVIRGCYKTSHPATGAVIVIDSEASCPSGFTALNWNQTGPQGPPGPGLQRVLSTEHLTPNAVGSHAFEGSVDCPAGMQAINGGLWERTAEQAWIDAITNDPEYPDVFAGIGTSQFLAPQLLGTGPELLDQTPSTLTNDVTADGTGWYFVFSGQSPFWSPDAGTPPTYYAVDVTFWVACAQPQM